jgi:type IV secretory pathway TrbF-like protein
MNCPKPLSEKYVESDELHPSAISDNSYQVQWSEQAFDRNGVLVESVRYTGIFNITIQEPTTEKMILSNPLGLFIDFFSLSQELS